MQNLSSSHTSYGVKWQRQEFFVKPENRSLRTGLTSQIPPDFEELFHVYKSSVYRFACHLTRNRGEAEDLFQEAWLRVVRLFPGEIDRERFKAWLFTVVANIHKDDLRKKRIRRLFFIGISRDSSLNHEFHPYILGQSSSSSSCALEDIDIHKALQRAIAKLPERQRWIFALKEIEGFQYREISEIIGLPVGTVKSLLHRTVKRLRKELAAYNPKKERWTCDAKTLSV
ncbi:MAG: sigma-70 family RNA polymerase sigma factor [Candidatus Aminicenantes bacterium]|nr:sigma-70 family RNA polymerase sigma factor [Candidatus Aminicenantes bacterium]